jgi:hypothetical protein
VVPDIFTDPDVSPAGCFSVLAEAPWFVRDALSIECPHCGETFSLAFDVSEGGAEFVTDCEVCCRPMVVTVRVTDGAVDGVEIAEC